MKVLQIDYNDNQAPSLFTQSLKETGFAVLKNHPIPFDQLESMYKSWQRFFESPEKQNYLFDKETQAGYFPFQSENAKDSEHKDLKEFYHIYPKQELPFPVESITLKHYELMNSLAQTLLEWIETSLPEDIKNNLSQPLPQMVKNSPQTLLRVLYYPALNEAPPVGAIRAAAHEDINLITLLPASTAPGLQAQDSTGTWHDINCDPGQLVVNVGDMLQLATNGYLISTTHRVMNPAQDNSPQPRLSMPLFLHPKPDVMLSQEKSAQSYLNERLKEIGLI